MQKGATEWTDAWVLTYMQTDGQVDHKIVVARLRCYELSLTETKIWHASLL